MTELEFQHYCKHYLNEGYEEISKSSERAIYIKVHVTSTEFVEVIVGEDKPRVTFLDDEQMEDLLNS